ncbi:sigma 54-interacting transcriptional regulator [bacterium]|nr:sigma 54-interacting transcriptional regulator [bacterium]
MSKPQTIGELKKAGYKVKSVKEEIRSNLIQLLRGGKNIFPGIVGYDKTVIPELIHAVLSRHDFILLGLRGQAKTRILRSLVNLLDKEIPVIKDAPLNDNPFAPISRVAIDMVEKNGDQTEIRWLGREERYGEKLATPDVTVADLIGDIDPIKAATQKLHYADERVMHFGVIPRSNRGIFAINELPDLQPRIQVSLFNILEEKDFQIRGFNIRIPLDILVVFSANPEDYTNRGNIITPLKDRIDSQILTHYPLTIEDGMHITEQEAWQKRDSGDVPVPFYFKEIIESIAFQARASEFIDHKSGVSARLTISCLENLISTAERRAILHNEEKPFPRICDLYYLIPSITGKIELVYEGEQQGMATVAKVLIGRAIKSVFKNYFPDPLSKKDLPAYQPILAWFASGHRIEISNDTPFKPYFDLLNSVPSLKEVALKHMKANASNAFEVASAMEFVLEGLHQNSSLSKDWVESRVSYKDMMGSMLGKINWDKEE